jgi:hypothetical protein
MVCVESVSLWQLTDFWETMEIALLNAENFTEFSLNTPQRSLFIVIIYGVCCCGALVTIHLVSIQISL